MDKNRAPLKKESDSNNQKKSNTSSISATSTGSSAGAGGIGKTYNSSKSGNKNFGNKINKRSTPKLSSPLAKNHLYINNKSNLKVQLKHCEDLINSGITEIYLHALGNTIAKATNLGLILVQNSNGALSYEANTSTVENYDDIVPIDDESDFTINQRLCSCLHIKITTNIHIQ